MFKRKFSIVVILAIIAAAFFYAGGAQAAPTNLSAEAGIAAYTQVDEEVNLEAAKSTFLMVEYQTDGLVVGTLDLPLYETVYDPLVLVTADGWIVAFYPNSDPAGKLADVISKNLDETLLEKAVKIVAAAAGVEDVTTLSISHYDFGNPAADQMLLVAEYEADGNAFTLQFEGSNDYYEKSYAFYRTFAPSFKLDNDTIDQVNFIEANADYFGIGYYGTIYSHFPVVVSEEEEIDFDPGVLNTFAVQAGDHLGFGALAILYAGDAPTVADADFSKTIPLASPGVDPVFDLTPGSFLKDSPDDGETGVGLAPTLSWDASSAPNYEYCIDIEEVNNDECDTSWISTGSSTSAALSNLLYETTYYWQVRAVNSETAVEANGGTWWSFTTADGIAPGAFTKDSTTLREPIDSLSKVTMTWTPSYGAYYYEVCVDTTADCVAPELWHNVGLATSATIGDLLLDTTYHWQVRAWNGFDASGNLENPEYPYYTYADAESQWETFTTRTFSKLRPVDLETYNLTLPFKWEATPIAEDDKYEYCIDQSDDEACGNSWKKVTGTSVVVNSKKDKLAAGTYYWQVRTDGLELEANGGEWWEFTVLSKKDLRKINLFKDSPVDGAVDQPASGLELSWNATGTNMSYEYCFFFVDDTDTTPISYDDTCTYDEDNWVFVGTATSATIPVVTDPPSFLESSTTYYWQVRANGTLYADKGDYWAFTTLP